MLHDHKGKIVIVDSRRGLLRRTKVLGLTKCSCAEIKWEDTGKSEMVMMNVLCKATLEDGTPVCPEEHHHHGGMSM